MNTTIMNPARPIGGGHSICSSCHRPALPVQAAATPLKHRNHSINLPRIITTKPKPNPEHTRKIKQLPSSPAPLHTITPLVHDRDLSNMLGCNVWLKMDNEQPSGESGIPRHHKHNPVLCQHADIGCHVTQARSRCVVWAPHAAVQSSAMPHP